MPNSYASFPLPYSQTPMLQVKKMSGQLYCNAFVLTFLPNVDPLMLQDSRAYGQSKVQARWDFGGLEVFDS